MAILKIGATDFSDYVSSLKVDKEFLTSEKSGRNASGTMSIDLIATKYKLTVGFRPLSVSEASALATAISSYSNLSVSFQNPHTNTQTTISAYIGTPSIEWYRYSNNLKLTKPFNLSIIEM